MTVCVGCKQPLPADQLVPGEKSMCEVCRTGPDAPKLLDNLVEKATSSEFKRLAHKYDTTQRTQQIIRDRKSRVKTAKSVVHREMAARELSRRLLMQYIQRFNDDYQAGWAHRFICARLETFMKQIENRESPRLMIFLPPRFGKSKIASVEYPSFVLGHHPEWEIIQASYALSLPIEHSRMIRERLREPMYNVLFPKAELSPVSKSAETWRTTKNGGLLASGVSGGITGRGAHLFIIDDPVKDAAEADSEAIRNSVWDWYTSTAYTRLAPGGGMLLIQTRWNDLDLAGRCIIQMDEQIKAKVPQEEIDMWDIISLPALAETDEYVTEDGRYIQTNDTPEVAVPYRMVRQRGDAVHEDRFPKRKMKSIRRTLPPRFWSAMYQQKPVPDEGSFFTRSMFKYYEDLPPYVAYYAAWDLAISSNTQADYTVGLCGAVDPEHNLYLVDMRRGRWGDSIVIVDNMLDMFEQYKPEVTGIEASQVEMAIGPLLDMRIGERQLYDFVYETLPIRGRDKMSRARPIQGRMQQGRVYLPRGAEWVDDLISELLRFPSGRNDDIVDSLAWLGQMLNGIVAMAPRVQATRVESWRDRLHKYTTRKYRQRSAMTA